MTEHFIIIPFSFPRMSYIPGKSPDPLEPAALKKRFDLLRAITLPSIMTQTNRNFKLILIIDPLLPQQYRMKLREITDDLKSVFFIDHRPEVSQNTITWMKPLVSKSTDFLIVTKLDADDALYKGFTQYVQEYVKCLLNDQTIQPFQVISCKNFIQWDFIHSRKAPMGYIKLWLREDTITPSSGLTFCIKYPQMDISVIGINHRNVGFMFYENLQVEIPGKNLRQVDELREMIKRQSELSGLKWSGEISAQGNHHEIPDPNPQMIVVNHLLNVRYLRMFEGRKKRNPVRSGDDLSDFGIDFSSSAKLIRENRLSFLLVTRIAIAALFSRKATPQKDLRSRLQKTRMVIRVYFHK